MKTDHWLKSISCDSTKLCKNTLANLLDEWPEAITFDRLDDLGIGDSDMLQWLRDEGYVRFKDGGNVVDSFDEMVAVCLTNLGMQVACDNID